MKLIMALILSSIFVVTTISCQGTPTAQPGLEKTEPVSRGISGVKGQDYVKSELLVKFRSGVSRPAIEEIIGNLNLEIIKVVSAPNLYLLKVRGDSTIPEIIDCLKQVEGVEYSEPNYIRRRDSKK